MAKITSLAELTDVASDDLFVVVDKSDTSMSDSGTDKKVKKSSLAKSLLDFFYPVGTIYETTSSDLDTVAKMNAHFGGTWEFYGAGRVLVAKSADTEFDTIGKTGGAKTVTLTSAQSGLPSHTHDVEYAENGKYPVLNGGGSDYNLTWGTSGNSSPELRAKSNTAQNASQAHTNLQPYIVVYRYRRIS